MNTNTNPTKVIVPCRFSYLHCWEPDSVNGSEPKYSVSAIIPKSDTKTVNAIKAAIEQAKKDSVSKWGGKVPGNLKLPLRDGDIDRPDDEAYAGCYFFNANSRQAPQVVDSKVQPILDQSEVYSGCYGKISVTFYGYNSNGNRGIAAGLGNIQKLKDGESLGGRTSAADDFQTEDEDDFLD
nr:MAG TPA: DNA helix destabilizing protein [Caudoviricetes sp.]